MRVHAGVVRGLGIVCLALAVAACDDSGGDAADEGDPGDDDGSGAADASTIDASEPIADGAPAVPDAAPPPYDAGPPPPLDPAPGVETPGENGGPGMMCPDTDEDVFAVDVGAATAVDLAGTVTGLAGTEGIWYVRGAGGQELAGPFAVDGAGAWAVSLPLLCGGAGNNVVKLHFPGATCPTTLVYQVTSTCTPSDLQITVTWDALGDDWELHLVRPGGVINSPTDDCTWTTCIGESPDWGVVGDASDDPHKDVDDVDAYGPENIILDGPADGVYHVMVEHWGPGSPESDGAVLLVVGDQSYAFYRQDLPSLAVWTVATVTFPGGVVTPVDTTFDCTASWSSGCTAPIPAP